MTKLLMITGLGAARNLASGKKGALFDMLQEFHHHWDQIDIISPKVTPNYKLQTINYFGNVFIHISPCPLIFHPIFFIFKVLSLNRKIKFNLMTVHEFPPFYNGIAAKIIHRLVKIPYVLEVHHIPGHPRTAGVKELIYRNLVKIFVVRDSSTALTVRVVNQIETPQFLKENGVLSGKIKYIPSMYIDLDVFKPLNIRKEYDLVFAARLEKNKGIINLVEAIKIAKQKKSDIKLLIIGQGSEKRNLESGIKNLGLEKNIKFAGWLETSQDVAQAYNSARIFINPSFNEGGPRVVLEAMACGLPVITTRVGFMNDIIKDDRNGLFTDWEPVDMAEKIVSLLENDDLQNRFSKMSLGIAQKFEKKAMIKNYAEELKDLIL